MAFIPTPQTAKMVLRGLQEGDTVINVFHIHYTGTFTTARATDWANAFTATVLPKLVAFLSDNYTAQDLTITDLAVVAGSQVIDILTGTAQGARGGTQESPGVAVATTLKTGISGRSGRGRKFWGPFGNNDINGKYLGGFLLTAVNALGAALVTYGVAGDYRLAVASAKNHVSHSIVAAAVDYLADSMRRRLGNRGI